MTKQGLQRDKVYNCMSVYTPQTKTAQVVEMDKK